MAAGLSRRDCDQILGTIKQKVEETVLSLEQGNNNYDNLLHQLSAFVDNATRVSGVVGEMCVREINESLQGLIAYVTSLKTKKQPVRDEEKGYAAACVQRLKGNEITFK
jgi:hypothetical protein